MSETARLIGMLRASASTTTNCNKSSGPVSPSIPVISQDLHNRSKEPSCKAIPAELLEHLLQLNKQGVPRPEESHGVIFKISLSQVITTLDSISPIDPINPLQSVNMAGRLPSLTTSELPRATAEESSATASPARGSAMRANIFKSVRVPEFRFKWMFWAEKGQQSAPKDKAANSEEYASRPKPLGEQIISVKEFYQHFNNIPVESLKLRDSIHLFHLGVKPVWEDPRNARGGAWYFKISKDIAAQFWHEICLLAVGDVLQGAIETKRDGMSFPVVALIARFVD